MTKQEGRRPTPIDAELVNDALLQVAKLPGILAMHPIEGLRRVPPEIDSATLFPPNAPALAETYRTLEALVWNRQNPQRRLAAIMIGDIIHHQTTRPPEEKAHAILAPRIPKQGGTDVVKTIADLAVHQQPTDESTAESTAAAAAFKAALDEALTDFDILPEHTARTPREFQTRVAAVRNAYTIINSPLYHMHEHFGSKDNVRRIGVHQIKYLRQVAADPQALPALLQGEFTDVRPLEIYSWIQHQAMASILGDTGEEPERLKDYFFEHPSVQEGFWEYTTRDPKANYLPYIVDAPHSRITAVSEAYAAADRFFTHPEAGVAQAFVQSAPLKETKGENKAMYAMRLVDYVALFKTLHPNHPNLPLVMDTLERVLKETNSRKATNVMMSILKDKQPGIIYVVTNNLNKGKPYFGIPHPDGPLDDAIAQIEPNNLHYISAKKQQEDPPSASSEPAGRTARKIEVMAADPVLKLPPGENVIRPGWYWPEVHVPQPESVPALLRHLQKKFTDEGDFEAEKAAYYDLVISLDDHHVKDHGVTRAWRRAAVIPHKLPQGNQLSKLSKSGILGVIRDFRNISVIINAPDAGVQTSGSGIIELKGRLDDLDGFLEIDDATPEFASSPLYLAIRAAALQTHQPPAEITRRPKSPKTEGTPVGGADSPIVLQEFPGINEMGVVIPIDMKGKVTMYTLKPAA